MLFAILSLILASAIKYCFLFSGKWQYSCSYHVTYLFICPSTEYVIIKLNTVPSMYVVDKKRSTKPFCALVRFRRHQWWDVLWLLNFFNLVIYLFVRQMSASCGPNNFWCLTSKRIVVIACNMQHCFSILTFYLFKFWFRI